MMLDENSDTPILSMKDSIIDDCSPWAAFLGEIDLTASITGKVSIDLMIDPAIAICHPLYRPVLKPSSMLVRLKQSKVVKYFFLYPFGVISVAILV